MDKLATEYMINEQENVTIEVSRVDTSIGYERFISENGTDDFAGENWFALIRKVDFQLLKIKP